MPCIQRDKGYTFKILGFLEIHNNIEKLQGLIAQCCNDVSVFKKKKAIKSMLIIGWAVDVLMCPSKCTYVTVVDVEFKNINRKANKTKL